MTALSDLKTQQADLLQRLRQAETIVASETVDATRPLQGQNGGLWAFWGNWPTSR